MGRDLAVGQLHLLHLLALGRMVILVPVDPAAVLEVELVHHLPLVALVVDVADVEEDVLPVGVLGDAEHGVGRFALIVPVEPAAQGHGQPGHQPGHHPDDHGRAEEPTADIGLRIWATMPLANPANSSRVNTRQVLALPDSTMRLFHDKHFRQQTFFLVNWMIYAAVGLLGG